MNKKDIIAVMAAIIYAMRSTEGRKDNAQDYLDEVDDCVNEAERVYNTTMENVD